MSTRIKAVNAAAVVAYFADQGIVVTVRPVTNYSLNGGCSDPEHCPQHPAAWNPAAWRQVHGVSGAQLHRALLDLGIVDG